MSSVRPAAVSGTFYPAVRAKLHQMVIAFLNEVQVEAVPIKALIVPHAGYIYSGSVAAGGYARLTSQSASIKRVVLLGPSHRVAFAGIAVPKLTVFETPLGQVEVDQRAIDSLLDLPWIQRFDDPHLQEHSLEVQLPFLQTVLNDFALVPLVVGQADSAQVAEVISRLWGGDETLIVVSSDLSHYLDYDSARKIDMKTTRAIEDLRAQDIEYDQACGRLPIQGLLQVIKKRGLRCITVDLRNSGDTAGPRDHVVGYGAYVFN